MPKLGPDAHGVFIISATPFTDDGAIDIKSTHRLVDFYRTVGATGITGFNIYSMIVAIIGAIVVLWLYHLLASR